MTASIDHTGTNHGPFGPLICVLLAMCAGCGGSFDEGDEAWIHIPGDSFLADTYLVVEVDHYSDRGARVRPDGRNWEKRVFGERIEVFGMGLSRGERPKLVRRLRDGGTAYVDKDILIDPDEAESAYEWKREIALTLGEFLVGSNNERWEFMTDGSKGNAEYLERTLEVAKDLRIDEAALAVEMLLATINSLSGVAGGDADLDEEVALNEVEALRRCMDEVFDLLRDDEGRFRALNKVLNARLEAETFDAAVLVAAKLIEPTQGRTANGGPIKFRVDADLDDMVEGAGALIEFRESVYRLLTMDGARKSQGEFLDGLQAAYLEELSGDIRRMLYRSINIEDLLTAKDVKNTQARLEEIGDEFEDELELQGIGPRTGMSLHRRVANNLQTRIDSALGNGAFATAASAVAEYMGVQKSLATLLARHDRSSLNGPDSERHLARVAEQLALRLESGLRGGALPVAVAAVQEGEEPTSVDERVKLWAEPFSSALGRDLFNEDFYGSLRLEAEVALRREAVKPGQMWFGWIQCDSLPFDSRSAYARGSSSAPAAARASESHGLERLSATLLLSEDNEDKLDSPKKRQIQGVLIAQNLAKKRGWRRWDEAVGGWRDAERETSSQFVVLTYQPSSMAANISYGVLDKHRHVQKHGHSPTYTKKVQGSWSEFHGSGQVDLDEGTISGKVTAEYVDRSCVTFRLGLRDSAGPPASGERADAAPSTSGAAGEPSSENAPKGPPSASS